MLENFPEQNAKILNEVARLENLKNIQDEESSDSNIELSDFYNTNQQNLLLNDDNSSNYVNLIYIICGMTATGGLIAGCNYIYNTYLSSNSINLAQEDIIIPKDIPKTVEQPPVTNIMGSADRGLVSANKQRFENINEGKTISDISTFDDETIKLRAEAAQGIVKTTAQKITEPVQSVPYSEPSVEINDEIKDVIEHFNLTDFIVTHKWKVLIVSSLLILACEEYYNDYPISKGIKNTYEDFNENGLSVGIGHLIGKAYIAYDDVSSYLLPHNTTIDYELI